MDHYHETKPPTELKSSVLGKESSRKRKHDSSRPKEKDQTFAVLLGENSILKNEIRSIIDLVEVWDDQGVKKLREPLSWETAARMAIDHALHAHHHVS